MNYYDAVLMVIPSLFLLGGGVSLITNISPQVAVIVGASAGVLVVAHSLFINPPVDPERLPTVDSDSVEESSSYNTAKSILSDD